MILCTVGCGKLQITNDYIITLNQIMWEAQWVYLHV